MTLSQQASTRRAKVLAPNCDAYVGFVEIAGGMVHIIEPQRKIGRELRPMPVDLSWPTRLVQEIQWIRES